MKTRIQLASILLSASLLGLAGCAANPADNVPKASVGDASTPATTAAASSGTPSAPTPATGTPVAAVTGTPSAAVGTVLPFVEGTEVGFKGSKVTGSHEGGFKKVEGSVTVPDGAIEKSTVDVKIDMTSVYTDEAKLTGHLSSPDFFDVAQFPTSTFKSTSITPAEKGYTVTGDLTLHGVTKSISFPAEIKLDGGTLTTKAEFAINRKDFAIAYAGKADDLIRDEVVIKFDLKAAAGPQG